VPVQILRVWDWAESLDANGEYVRIRAVPTNLEDLCEIMNWGPSGLVITTIK